jgi:hypothetical protein
MGLKDRIQQNKADGTGIGSGNTATGNFFKDVAGPLLMDALPGAAAIGGVAALAGGAKYAYDKYKTPTATRPGQPQYNTGTSKPVVSVDQRAQDVLNGTNTDTVMDDWQTYAAGLSPPIAPPTDGRTVQQQAQDRSFMFQPATATQPGYSGITPDRPPNMNLPTFHNPAPTAPQQPQQQQTFAQAFNVQPQQQATPFTPQMGAAGTGGAFVSFTGMPATGTGGCGGGCACGGKVDNRQLLTCANGMQVRCPYTPLQKCLYKSQRYEACKGCTPRRSYRRSYAPRRTYNTRSRARSTRRRTTRKRTSYVY